MIGDQVFFYELKGKFFLRFVVVAAGLSVIGFFALASFMATTRIEEHALIPQARNTETKVIAPKTSEPYSRKESAVYSTYDDIDATNPNFDVGKYCLEKEKRGSITFEECLGVAATKIMSKQ